MNQKQTNFLPHFGKKKHPPPNHQYINISSWLGSGVPGIFLPTLGPLWAAVAFVALPLVPSGEASADVDDVGAAKSQSRRVALSLGGGWAQPACHASQFYPTEWFGFFWYIDIYTLKKVQSYIHACGSLQEVQIEIHIRKYKNSSKCNTQCNIYRCYYTGIYQHDFFLRVGFQTGALFANWRLKSCTVELLMRVPSCDILPL